MKNKLWKHPYVPDHRSLKVLTPVELTVDFKLSQYQLDIIRDNMAFLQNSLKSAIFRQLYDDGKTKVNYSIYNVGKNATVKILDEMHYVKPRH